jgi:hypothetical protein
VAVTSFSERILDACEIKRGLYVLHPEFQRVNFYSQQLRALALVEGIYRHRGLPEGARNVAVIGAGVAGLTAAAALATAGANVALIEEEETPLSRYRDAVHRELHPNIIAWPFQRLRAITDLPFLNWCCGPASRVREQILQDWNTHFRAKISFTRRTVTRVDWTDRGIVVRGEGNFEVTKHHVVVTTGFLEEMSGDGVVQNPYWHSSTMPARSVVTVSGIGDGGLIDVATQFYGHKTVDACRALAYAIEPLPMKNDIRIAENEATELASRDQLAEARERLAAFYPGLALENETTDALAAFEIDEGRRVNLYYRRGPSPYRPLVAPISKVMFVHCREKFGDRMFCEEGKWTRNGATVAFDPPPPTFDAACVLMRHGAPHGAYAILDADDIRALEAKEGSFADLLNGFAEDEYDQDLFVNAPVRPIAPSSLNDFLAMLEVLLQELLSHCDKGHYVGYKLLRDSNRIPLTARHGAPIHVTQMFPIAVHAIEIGFGESTDFDYPSVPSTELLQ